MYWPKKNTHLLSYSFGGQMSNTGLNGLKLWHQEDRFLLEAVPSVFLAFQFLEISCLPWVMVHSFVCKARKVASLTQLAVFFYLFILLVWFTQMISPARRFFNLNQICKVPFAIQGNICTGSMAQGVYFILVSGNLIQTTTEATKTLLSFVLVSADP